MVPRLGDILIRKGVISEEQLRPVLASQSNERGMLGAILLRRRMINADELGAALQEQFNVPFCRLVPEAINPQVIRLVPESLARSKQLVPIGVDAGRLQMAMAAPDDIGSISETELITGYHVEPCVALENEIHAVIERGFDDRIVARQTIVDMRLAELKRSGNSPTELGPRSPAVASDEAPVVRLVRAILLGAVNAGASDIHLEPHVPEMRVRYRVDGEMQQVMTIPRHIEEAVISRIKVMADMDTTETRRPQDGRLTIDDDGAKAYLRVSTIPTVGGEKAVMRILDEGGRVFSLEQLGLCERDRLLFQQLIDKPLGMCLVTGPTGSGKSTTMYAMLSALNSTARNIVTVEDPVEYRLPGINQVGADNEHGMGFANALKHIMRQDPDVIMVGEIRDGETARLAVQAALTGHLLISTMHTNDAVGAIPRLNDLGIDPFKIAGALRGVIAQRLLRTICAECKEPVEPNPALLKGLVAARREAADATFFRGRGCRRCLGSGYAGRVAIFEIMLTTPALIEATERNSPATAIREIARGEGMVDLLSAGIDYAMAGRTTIEEVFYKVSS